MRSLLLSLEAIERACGQEISNKSNASRDKKASHSKKCGQERSKMTVASCNEKALHSNKWVRSNLVLTTVPESRRKLVPRNTVTFARSMGAHTRSTIIVIAVVLRKTEQKNPISTPLRKAERNPIL